MPEYIYTITPSREELISNPDSWTEAEVAIFKRHAAYLKQAAEDGIVIVAGRAQDGVGPAVVIFEAESDDAAQHFMNSDPFIGERLMHGSLHPFKAAFSRYHLKETA
jgi:uncharacterized protein YciI